LSHLRSTTSGESYSTIILFAGSDLFNEGNSNRRICQGEPHSFAETCSLLHLQDLDDIKVTEVPQPHAKDGEVIVQIAAAGVNFVDILYVRRGSYSVLHLWHLLCFFPPKSTRARMLRDSFRKLNILRFSFSKGEQLYMVGVSCCGIFDFNINKCRFHQILSTIVFSVRLVTHISAGTRKASK
jgi:hypothetical protein